MGYYRLTPKAMEDFSPDDLALMLTALRMQEQKQSESIYDIIGNLTGTSWSVEALTAEENEEEEEEENNAWRLRPKRQRVTLPLTLVVGGNKLLDHVKKEASRLKMKARKHASIINVPSSKMLKDAEIVDLSNVPKEEFLQFANRVSRRG